MNKYIKRLVRKGLKEDKRYWNEIFRNRIYEMTRQRGRLGNVIDLGATQGEFSMYIYDLARKIYAIEPHRDCFRRLKRHAERLPKIKAFRYIISNSNGKKFLQGNDDGGATTKEQDGDNTQKVECRTLATFMKENDIRKVDVLKIDVESHEPFVFGSPDFKDVARKIKFIIGEHGSGLEEILAPLGFHFGGGFYAWR